MASPSPKSPEQSDKSKKYDRQLRLWGDHGQAALETAHVCLINASGLGTEILKSLVLPGIRAFTITDGNKVCEEDLGSNFFLDLESVGKSRAQAATQFLLELNPHVKGDYVDESADLILQNRPDFFTNFTIVIATSLPERILLPLSKTLWEENIPLIVARSLGLSGYCRVQLSEHTVVESHPDTQNPDLRLDAPFPTLKAHLDSMDLETLDLKTHSHIPYIVPLYKALEKWRASNQGTLPKTFKEKESLRDELRKLKRTNDDGSAADEENFEEAIRAVNYAVLPSTIPKSVQNILDDHSCVNLTSKSSPFWILAKSVREFTETEGEGLLPLRGSLPDMTSDTASYIAIQQIYQQESLRQAEWVHRRAQQLLHQLGHPDDLISDSDTRRFCKNAGSLALLRGSPLAAELEGSAGLASAVGAALEDPSSLAVLYIMYRALDRFLDEYNRYPGQFSLESDIVKLKLCVTKLLTEWACPPLPKDDYVQEFCRYGGLELHSVAAFLGGCVAHEAIKIITGQYKPINNTFIYDATTLTTETFYF